MSAQKISIDASGTLSGFSYHDGLLYGIESKNRVIRLQIKNSSGESICLKLMGSTFLSVNEFYEGNIIDSIFFWEMADVPKEVAINFEKCGWVAQKVTSGECESKMFVLECSYGATVLAVIKNIAVEC